MFVHLFLKRKKKNQELEEPRQTSSRDGGGGGGWETLVPLLEKGQSHWDRGEAAAALPRSSALPAIQLFEQHKICFLYY
jgi:hypothetical protein